MIPLKLILRVSEIDKKDIKDKPLLNSNTITLKLIHTLWVFHFFFLQNYRDHGLVSILNLPYSHPITTSSTEILPLDYRTPLSNHKLTDFCFASGRMGMLSTKAVPTCTMFGWEAGSGRKLRRRERIRYRITYEVPL